MRIFLVSLLLVAGCREEGFYNPPHDFASLEDLDESDLSDLALADLTRRPPDLTGIDAFPTPMLTPGASDRFLIGGTLLTPSGPLDGELLVEGNVITCVAASCSGQAGATGATVIRTLGLVMPGMLDAHNHGLYDIFDETDWSPTKLYDNHTQWTAEPRYGEMGDAKRWLDSEDPASTIDVNCEMDKFAEAKALVGATTSILIAPGTSRACYASLARTIDTNQNDLANGDKIRTSVAIPSASTAISVCNGFTSGSTDAYVIHVSEGLSPDLSATHSMTALNEFYKLASLPSPSPTPAPGCLLSPHTTIVHGTALGMPEFSMMAAHDMKLVWSPKSNVFLYGDTARIDTALTAGVQTIALAPDWSMGGSINLLDELAFAAAWDDAHFGDVISDERLFKMVTIDAAKALAVDSLLGSLEVGKRADLVLLAGDPSDPYGSVVKLRPTGVQLVMVDGRALYGEAPLVAAGPAAPGCETIDVCGASKFLCAAETSTADLLNETWAQTTDALTQALASYDTMVAASGIKPFSPLAPLVKCP